ncbi:hypothetical protein BKM31_50050 [[Actinomadura] parvosata subsp. kistnae]|uniref:Uncharacterized protein n=1 Tax=[Actinomadura] parvosata subsp. kistnae TaxID=1909395 RepID=A0A1V0AE87_9ACTN|nr:hypothetical protein [Nonomuraea sp. ATCC 55076]AQZ68544.1 hypothetical protein BKM31_50050 [Nonomuraea sp. ATCC 55076]
MTRDEIEQALRRAEDLTGQIKGSLDRAVRLMGQPVWTGPAANRFGRDLAAQRQALMKACAAAVDEFRYLLARTPE